MEESLYGCAESCCYFRNAGSSLNPKLTPALSVNADSLGENDAVGAAVAAAFPFFVRGMCVGNLWFATATF